MKSKNLVICLLIIIVLVLGSYICYDKFFSDKTTNDKDEPKVEEKKEEVETEVTDVNVIKELSNKVDTINVGSYGKSKYDKDSDFNLETEVVIFAIEPVLKNELNDETKELIVLNSLENKTVKINTTNVIPSYETEYIEKEDFDKRSIELFNKNLEVVSITDSCPSYKYDDQSKRFDVTNACGYEANDTLRLYKYKFSQLNDNAYVYVSSAFDKFLGAEEGKIYSNFDLKNKNYVLDSDYYSGDRNFKIGKDNYNDFVKYRYNFKKNESGNYYFVGVEKI